MKFIALTIVLFILSVSFTDLRTAAIQKPTPQSPSEIEKIEAEFKELDLEDDENIKIEVSASGKISIKVHAIEFSKGKEGDEKTSDKSFKISTRKELDIDLKKINIPDEYPREPRPPVAENKATGTLPGVMVEQIDATNVYEVCRDYTYQAKTFSITARRGFRYDRASVPKPLWFIDRDSLSNVPALIHDLLYRNGGKLQRDQVTPYRTFTRREADDIFLELMTKAGVKKWRCRLAYEVVKAVSGFAWQEKQETSTPSYLTKGGPDSCGKVKQGFSEP